MNRAREVRVAYATTHAEAITEAQRRIRMMHNLWPDQAWRIRIRRRRDPLRRRHIWVLYAIPPKGTWL
jgi:hypothetical protein